MNGRKLLFILPVIFALGTETFSQKLPSKRKILKPLRLTNEYFMKKWTDPGKSIITNREQGTGKEPKDGQPVTYTSVPDFEDYGLGCFLLAGSEMYKLK